MSVSNLHFQPTFVIVAIPTMIEYLTIESNVESNYYHSIIAIITTIVIDWYQLTLSTRVDWTFAAIDYWLYHWSTFYCWY